MRPKVVITTLTIAAGLLVLSGLASKFLTRRTAAMATAPQAESTSNQPQITKPAAVTSPAVKPTPATKEALDQLAALQNQRHKEYVRQRIDELNELAIKEDEPSHAVILSELTNADPEIRHAALEALIQTRDRSVLPRLGAIAEITEDPEEKAALLEAVKFISLPSLTDHLTEPGRGSGSRAVPATRSRRRLDPKPRPNPRP